MQQKNFKSYNDTTIAHLFVRLISCKNSPYNDDKLSLEQFEKEYNELSDYIEWKESQCILQNNYSLYNFTPERMRTFLTLIKYDFENKKELLELWKSQMCNFIERFNW